MNIIEATAEAMWQVEWGDATWPPAEDPEGAEAYRALARAAASLLLERAARVAADYTTDYRCISGHDRCNGIGDASCPYCERYSEAAAAIRALKEQP